MTQRLRVATGHIYNTKRVRRLMRRMGLHAIYPKPRTSMPGRGHTVYPYLMAGLGRILPNQAWCSDISYIPLQKGYMFLVAVMDWASRHVLAWRLSNTMTVDFCLAALDAALDEFDPPELFNTDQGAQFTAAAFQARLLARGVRISMDGRGRALDNVFIERLWRSVKYENVYLRCYAGGQELYSGLRTYFTYYNHKRPHQGLDGKTPAEVYHACA
jgi:putative transposase